MNHKNFNKKFYNTLHKTRDSIDRLLKDFTRIKTIKTVFVLIIAYSDKMLFLDLGPGTSDLGSLI